jgi:hypothetical protein
MAADRVFCRYMAGQTNDGDQSTNANWRFGNASLSGKNCDIQSGHGRAKPHKLSDH